MGERLVILDRDGVINFDSDSYIRSADEWEPIPGSLEAIGQLARGGYRIGVASNQSGIARGYFTLTELNAMHKKLHERVASHGGRIDIIAFCPHAPGEGCGCRKPQPGLLLDIAERLHLDLAGAAFIGDSITDLRAARAVGARPILVKTGKGDRTLAQLKTDPGLRELAGVPVHEDLAAAVAALLNE